ncbi:MAG: 4-hydroxythreonine-4-phosphate dehydrogenase PdxA [Gammaproteobacteria bacterium]|nr:4-hydroxythreonine-4-phosphate dehydrogenase PdxA [Gammaproteobacteria bacterium]MCP4089572.1 4-hydroxythreonine-4-phosphate dehydrogenase PdxA [Gammaproteobacteria bacterium]MCP4278093.1 4-hydroxythreonine-4-phosphate dehydrogenase PdxA [Gammaproteobacteria bacterium]MCP4832463.1 4-hydroxythreonine-4-phosphate dehydrogenase PdxA [Gammaproteobacteria bacterium]MCP4930155.1 4-hydroxythreonine-4-phosphate dehydrogenase PdxA [Gammaproteobacteria bacterium]
MLRIAITPGEPAGIGPDLVIALAQQQHTAIIISIADPDMLAERARQLGMPLTLIAYDASKITQPVQAGQLLVYPEKLAATCKPGVADPLNAPYVLNSLRKAADGCQQGNFDAMLTAPVNKASINNAGITFSGHTEFLAEHCGSVKPVMLLCADQLRVALLTTHLPLSKVAEQITTERILSITRILHHDLQTMFGIDNPHIALLGLNPHAGEAGHLGHEELSIIEPAIMQLQAEGLKLSGPLPADSAFTPDSLKHYDAVLAMYHDQGLPVLKHVGFGNAVNVTLGLPIIRTSVDHGTALELAGTGKAHSGSIEAAFDLALEIATRQHA